MARNLILIALAFSIAVITSLLTTEFLGAQSIVKAATVQFKDQVVIQSATLQKNETPQQHDSNSNNNFASGLTRMTPNVNANANKYGSPPLSKKKHVATRARISVTRPTARNTTTPVSSFGAQGETITTAASSVSPNITSTQTQVYYNMSTSMSMTTDTDTGAVVNAAKVKVITWEGVGDMNSFITSYWKGNKFCETMQGRNENHERPTLLNITFGCQDLFSKSGLGSGNFISAFYGARLAARVLGDVDVQMTCPDAEKEQTSLIIPWLMGNFPRGASHLVSDQQRALASTSSSGTGNNKNTSTSNLLHVEIPTIRQACGNYDKCPIGHMLPIIRYELRRMAIALVGVPDENHPAAAFAKRYLWNTDNKDEHDSTFANNTMQLHVPARDEPPLIPGVVLDDAVLHFRGGDLFNSNHPGFGFMKFSAFSKHISPDTKSIGIVTQPFDSGGQQRQGDSSSQKQQRHRLVVMALVDFLKEKFPQARITIHNGRNETIALAYARMIMADQTMAGISSFGVFPSLASFGTGYIRKPDYRKGPNQFLINPPIDQIVDNVVFMEEPNRLMAGTVKRMFQRPNGQDEVLEWFKNDSFCNGTPCL
jgi:hypothetical protein